MIRNFNIELEDNLYQQLKELCKGEESAMREYILQTLKEKLNQNDLNKLSKDQKKPGKLFKQRARRKPKLWC